MWFTRISIKNPVLATMRDEQGGLPPFDPPKLVVAGACPLKA
jgi:hypothetical protein